MGRRRTRRVLNVLLHCTVFCCLHHLLTHPSISFLHALAQPQSSCIPLKERDFSFKKKEGKEEEKKEEEQEEGTQCPGKRKGTILWPGACFVVSAKLKFWL